MRAAVSRPPSAFRARHRIEFLLLLGREQAADRSLCPVSKLPHLGPTVLGCERGVILDRLPLRGVSLDKGGDLAFLGRSETDRFIQAPDLFHRVVLPVAGFRPVGSLVTRSGRRLRRLGFVGRAGGGQGGSGQAGCESGDSEHRFHRLSFRTTAKIAIWVLDIVTGHDAARFAWLQGARALTMFPQESTACGIYIPPRIPHCPAP